MWVSYLLETVIHWQTLFQHTVMKLEQSQTPDPDTEHQICSWSSQTSEAFQDPTNFG